MKDVQKDLIKDLLTCQFFGVLSTNNFKIPYSNIVSFIPSSDCKRIYFLTRADTRKFNNVVNNPHVSFLVDNRKNDIGDVEKASILTAIGKAFKVDKFMHQDILDSFLDRFTNLKNFINRVDTMLLEIKIDQYIFVSEFEKVQVITVN